MAENSEKKLKKTSSFRYAVGMFGTSIPINMFKTFATAFYVDRLSFITFEQFAIITAIYTFLDAIDNPVYGFLSDRTRSKWGRRRPWLVIGAPLLVLAYIMFFNPPPFMQPGSAFAYVLIMYMLTGTLDSLINANYGALFPELFRTETERAKTNAIRQMFQLTAMVLSIALTPVITDKIGFSRTALVYGLLAIAVIWFMAFGSHEDLSLMEKPKPGLFSSIKAVITNPKFWKYGITNAAFAAAISLVQAGVPFYVKYYLGRSDGMNSFIANDHDDMRSLIAQARALGAVISVNHPECDICPYLWDNDEAYDMMEIWNGPMRAANVRALRKWTELLSSGRKIPAVGGSDFHRMMSPVRIGRPVNGVYSEDASSQGLLDAINSGHLFVASSLRGPSLLLTCGGRMMGDTVTTGEKSVEITVKAERLQGCRLFLVTAQGGKELSGENAVLPSNCVFVYVKAVKSGVIRAVTNPVYLRHTAHV